MSMLRYGCVVCGILLVVGSSLGQIVPQDSSIRNGYTALVPVNIRCVNDKTRGLTCNAEYPTQCKEQWNFPNPCTKINLSQNRTKFVHPLDTTKFLMCDEMGKLYVVQCPQYEVFHEGCGQCVGESAGLSASCERPLTQQVNNPCSREAIIANKLFFQFPGNLSKFIHCDIWGKAWERICTPGEVWSQSDVACVNPTLLNPCNRRVVTANVFFAHPCNPYKYLRCSVNRDALEGSCDLNKAFSEVSQRCEPVGTFNGPLENICGNFKFGFRIYKGPSPWDGQLQLTRPIIQGTGGAGAEFSSNAIRQGMGVSGSSVNAMNSLSQGNSLTAKLRIDGQTVQTDTMGSMFDGNMGSSIGGAMGGSMSGSLGGAVGGSMGGAMSESGSMVGGSISGQVMQQTGANTINQDAGFNNVQGTQGQQQGIDNNKFGLAIGGQQNRLSEILNVWRQNVAIDGVSGVSRLNDGNVNNVNNVKTSLLDGVSRLNEAALGGGVQTVQTGSTLLLDGSSSVTPKKGIMSVQSVHPSQLKEYVFSEIAYSDPCTVDNLSNGRTHFRMKGDPHSFLQCDNAGRMYRMPCSTNRRDWFDVYTMTCVDGPVHVDNQVLRSA